MKIVLMGLLLRTLALPIYEFITSQTKMISDAQEMIRTHSMDVKVDVYQSTSHGNQY